MNFSKQQANLIIVLFATGLLTLVVMDRAQEWWKKVYVRQFPFIFYYIVALFAFLHIYNFDVNTINWYYAPLMVVPQFILGIYLGYVRLRNNIWSSILIHAINNIIPMILFLTFGSKQKFKNHFETQHFKIIITKIEIPLSLALQNYSSKHLNSKTTSYGKEDKIQR